MPILFRIVRRVSIDAGAIKKYGWYAIGEVILIFVGITLALAFDNWNQERNLRRQEIAMLEQIADNLRANVDRLATTIAVDSNRLKDCQQSIALIEQRSPWRTEMSQILGRCRLWTSPFMRSAAYDSLKVEGIDLLSNRLLRDTIVSLYEYTYAYHAGDMDRMQWTFQFSVVWPVWNRYVRETPQRGLEPSNYEALLDSQEFLNMLYSRVLMLRASLGVQNESLDSTRHVISAIETELEQLMPD